MQIRKMVKALLPKPIVKAIRPYRAKRLAKEYQDLTTQQIFTKIYEENAWGKSDEQAQSFFSGNGSHEKHIVATYVTAIQRFLSSLGEKPDVVDLGCGDFNVGLNIRAFCENYVACDVVPSLIEFNKEKYKALNVDFRVLDLAEDDLPKADVVFIRQVLQHLSNRHIENAIPKISSSYKFLVLTEHLPDSGNFIPNLDKPAGPGVRPAFDSGLVLTKSPFNLKVKAERVLCEMPEFSDYGGLIRTTLYQLS
jgi:SAM-dependent methyltransferase